MVREKAREHLVAIGSTATSFLLPLLSNHESQTRWEAAKALSEIADPASIPALLSAFEDDDDDVRWLAAEALAAIGAPAAAPLLKTLIDGVGSAEIRQGAHHTLGILRHSEVGDKISEVYRVLDNMHPDVEIIADAERALQNLKSSG
jgi:HEAT repeat protein